MTVADDIESLTPKQQHVLGWIACNQDGGHHPRTLEALERKGLIESRDEKLGGFPPMTVKRYIVPLHVHIAWCEWCSAQEGDGD